MDIFGLSCEDKDKQQNTTGARQVHYQYDKQFCQHTFIKILKTLYKKPFVYTNNCYNNKMRKQQTLDSNSKSILSDTHRKMSIRRRVNTQSHNKNNLSTGQQTQMDQMKNKYSTDSKARLSNIRKNKYYNQFSQTHIGTKYPRADPGNIHEDKIQLDENDKDEKLQKLISRNNLLKEQIYRIQKLQQQSIKRSEVKKQYSSEQIYYLFSTKQSLTQELTNAYNKIKRMEAEINEIRKIQATDYNKIIGNLKQRLQQVDILKQNANNKLDKLKRFNKNLEEDIEKSRNRGGYRDVISQLKFEVQELANKQKQMNDVQTKRKEKNLKQQEYIRRLQKQLMENGVSKDFVQDMMNRVVYGDNTKKTIEPIKQTRQENLQKMQSQYKKMGSEMNILRKSIKQQQKLIQELVIMQKQSSDKHNKTKSLCKQLDEEIAKTQLSINQARKMINPQNLKPKPLPPKEPTLQEHRQQHKEHLKQVRRKFYQKKTKKYLKTLQSMQKQINEFTNLQMNNPDGPKKEQGQKQQGERAKENANKIQQLIIQRIEEQQADEQLFGKIDQNGIKFSDKYILEEVGKSQECKITSLTILNSQNQIVGVQAKYNYKMNGKLHQYNNLVTFRQNDKNYVNERITEEFQCVQQQFVTSITGTFSSKSILINLTVLTNLNRYHKFGSIVQDNSQFENNKQFQICNDANSYPSYIVGCVNRLGICQFGAKINKQLQSQSNNEEDQQY